MSVPVSVIIPLAPGEDEWRPLVPTLKLPNGSEILLATGSANFEMPELPLAAGVKINQVEEGKGRAGQMNAGAKLAQFDWLWFLHADSRLADDTLTALEACLADNEDGLFFFDLRFRDDGPKAMKSNEIAVRWRSDLLKMPFGDQGFLIKRVLFEELGGYREDLPYGEDHVFAWKTRQDGYPVRRTGGSLFTSARKYKTGGWFKVTAKHVWLTVLQAAPQALIYCRRRVRKMFS
ncbi:MAG: glycosyltransferase family 2 protein [Pseudomonadota bacterium]